MKVAVFRMYENGEEKHFITDISDASAWKELINEIHKRGMYNRGYFKVLYSRPSGLMITEYCKGIREFPDTIIDLNWGEINALLKFVRMIAPHQ